MEIQNNLWSIFWSSLWFSSGYGSATPSHLSPRPIFIQALAAGEMPWREVRASPVKARQHLFWCSPLTASAVTLHFGLFSNLQASIYFPIYFCLNILLMILQLSHLNIYLPFNFTIYFWFNEFSYIFLSRYISQYASAVTLHFRLFSNLHASIYFPTPFSKGGLRPNDLCVHKIFPHHSNVMPCCHNSCFLSFVNHFFLLFSEDLYI